MVLKLEICHLPYKGMYLQVNSIEKLTGWAMIALLSTTTLILSDVLAYYNQYQT